MHVRGSRAAGVVGDESGDPAARFETSALPVRKRHLIALLDVASGVNRTGESLFLETLRCFVRSHGRQLQIRLGGTVGNFEPTAWRFAPTSDVTGHPSPAAITSDPPEGRVKQVTPDQRPKSRNL